MATPSQPYRVVKKEKDIEIRFYPSATMATIRSSARTYKELASPGFRKLASFIFGGNQQGKSIAMTTPVQMDIQDTGSSMSFVMPVGYTTENIPKPNDPNVNITTSPEEYVAVIRFGGYATDQSIKSHATKLENILRELDIPYYGNFRFLGYNAPFQFINRRNEIIVKVAWNETSAAATYY